jgi:ATP-binding cassette, subfamily C (CFTR/MRP), member 1
VATFLCLQIALVTLWSLSSTTRTRTSIAEAVIGLFDAFTIAALSYVEHTRSVKPSIILNGYLFFSILLDIPLVRTFWIRPGFHAIAGVFTAALGTKATLLVLEETPKSLLVGEKSAPKETVAGVISRSVLWWCNKLLLTGSRLVIGVDDLGSIDDKFDSKKLLEQLETEWEKSEYSEQVSAGYY